jgi:hypothetical protein
MTIDIGMSTATPARGATDGSTDPETHRIRSETEVSGAE